MMQSSQNVLELYQAVRAACELVCRGWLRKYTLCTGLMAMLACRERNVQISEHRVDYIDTVVIEITRARPTLRSEDHTRRMTKSVLTVERRRTCLSASCCWCCWPPIAQATAADWRKSSANAPPLQVAVLSLRRVGDCSVNANLSRTRQGDTVQTTR